MQIKNSKHVSRSRNRTKDSLRIRDAVIPPVTNTEPTQAEITSSLDAKIDVDSEDLGSFNMCGNTNVSSNPQSAVLMNLHRVKAITVPARPRTHLDIDGYLGMIGRALVSVSSYTDKKEMSWIYEVQTKTFEELGRPGAQSPP